MVTRGSLARRVRGGGHGRIGVDAGDAVEVRGQFPGEHTRPAADVHGAAAARWQVTQDPAVPLVADDDVDGKQAQN